MLEDYMDGQAKSQENTDNELAGWMTWKRLGLQSKDSRSHSHSSITLHVEIVLLQDISK